MKTKRLCIALVLIALACCGGGCRTCGVGGGFQIGDRGAAPAVNQAGNAPHIDQPLTTNLVSFKF